MGLHLIISHLKMFMVIIVMQPFHEVHHAVSCCGVPCWVEPQQKVEGTDITLSRVPCWQASCLRSHGLMLYGPAERGACLWIQSLLCIKMAFLRCSSTAHIIQAYHLGGGGHRGVALHIFGFCNTSSKCHDSKFWLWSLCSFLETLKGQKTLVTRTSSTVVTLVDGTTFDDVPPFGTLSRLHFL
jgi:hypothetical protein